MNDRFKFRVYFKGSEYSKAGYQDLSRKDVIYSLKADGQIIRNVVYECQQEGHEGSPCNMPFEPNNDLYDIQFCTGLKDKNGKLIYEGDYIKNLKTNTIYKVFWEDKATCFMLKSTRFGGVVSTYMMFEEYPNNLEVIGNIYENKDLLKCENQ